MPSQPPSKGPKRPSSSAPDSPAPRRVAAVPLPSVPPITPLVSGTGEVGLGMAVGTGSGGDRHRASGG